MVYTIQLSCRTATAKINEKKRMKIVYISLIHPSTIISIWYLFKLEMSVRFMEKLLFLGRAL